MEYGSDKSFWINFMINGICVSSLYWKKDIEESEESVFSKLTSARSSVTSSALLDDEDACCANGQDVSVWSGTEEGNGEDDDVDTDTDDEGGMSGRWLLTREDDCAMVLATNTMGIFDDYVTNLSEQSETIIVIDCLRKNL